MEIQCIDSELEEEVRLESLPSSTQVNDEKHHELDTEAETDDNNKMQTDTEYESKDEESEQRLNIIKQRGKSQMKSKKKKKASCIATNEPTKLEENASQVQERFERGCECEDQCFKDLNPETVYKHRLNIAELTKTEHDMYLMGLIRSCLSNPYETSRHTERQRLRAQYVYLGKRVCLDAFLYLENCTLYQVKRIRKHLSMHGVTPRVHGNCGKVPHNTLSFDIYQLATKFVRDFIKTQEEKQKIKATNSAPLHLPPDVTRKILHNSYKEYCKTASQNAKIMGYSTFRTFLKVQFPQIKFAKLEFVVRTSQNQVSSLSSTVQADVDNAATIIAPSQSSEVLQEKLVPVIISNQPVTTTKAYIFTPENKLKPGISYKVTRSSILFSKSGDPLTITNVATT